MGDKEKKMGIMIKQKVYVLHGWTYDLEKWKGFKVLMEKNGFEVVVLKIPGLTLQSNEVWDIDKYSIWLSQKIGNEKGIILLGHSNGGRIAIHYASKNPKNIKKLVLIDSAGIYHKDFFIVMKRFIFGSLAKAGKLVFPSEGLKKLLYKMAREKDYLNASLQNKKTMISLVKSDVKELLPYINIPTLIIWGEKDTVTPMTDALTISSNVKSAKLVVIKEAKHSPFYTHAQEVVDIIKNDI
jgi:pimeloyl-ACP methyl ester carboxylesterase